MLATQVLKANRLLNKSTDLYTHESTAVQKEEENREGS